MDGVIVDTEVSRAKILSQLLLQHGGVSVVNEIFGSKSYGRTTEAVLRTDFAGQLTRIQIEIILATYQSDFKSNVADYAVPIEPTLAFIRQHNSSQRLAVASMSSAASIKQILDKHGITEKFSHSLSRDDVAKHKPDPEIYLLAAQRLRVGPKTCVVIEDTLIGAQAALAAGMSCYILLNGHNMESEFTKLPIGGFIRTISDYQRIMYN